MSPIDLPRPVEDYFAFAELAAGRDGRRFTITCPYLDGQKLERLQWWWQLGATQERILGVEGIAALRRQEALRFIRHIERWLVNNCKRLQGDEPIPRLADLPAAASESKPAPSVDPWPVGKVANG